MKNNLVLKILFSMVVIISLIANFSLAAYSDVTMTVESEPVCRIDITENSYFEKRLIEKDLENKEVTIQLKVVNDELPDIPTGELMLVIDNSDSMLDEIGSKTRAEIIHSSAKTLISKLLDGNDQLKIGITSFSSDPTQKNDGVLENDSKLISPLSNDASALGAAIDKIQDDGPRTDLDAGLTLAKQQFTSENTQKYMVILTDGVPNLSIGNINPYYSQATITQTKNTLKSLGDDGYKVITMLTGVANPDYIPGGATGKSFSQIIEEIFGTKTNPTVGDFFYIQDNEIERTITEEIFETLKPIYKSLKNIKVVDYFPQEIIDNFDFSYVSDPTHGSISAQVNPADNSIVWTIPELEAKETAIVQYKLKLKEEYDPQILDKLIDTNDHVDLDYDDFNGETQHKTSDVTPQLKLVEPEKPNVAPIPLPKAGTTVAILLGVSTCGFAIFSLIRYLKIHNDLKY